MIGRYLGGELDRLGEGELWRRSRDRDTLFLCTLPLTLPLGLGLRLGLGLGLGLLPLLSRLLLLLLLIRRCGCLSLLIGLGGGVRSVSGVRCVRVLHGRSQELRLGLLKQQLLLRRKQSRQLARESGEGQEREAEER